jgi:DNA end-binding protein Ku
MAGAASWSGSVRFGLIQFPIKAKAAVKETKFGFNYHHADEKCLGRLAQDGYVCTGCGEKVAKSETVKGYNGIAPVDTAYLESLSFEKNPVMELDGIVPAEQIDPRYYQKSYDVLPDKGGEKPYALFTKLLEESDQVAIGKVVMGGKEFIVTLRPRDEILAMEVMYWPEELKSSADAKAAIADVEVSESELELGRKLMAQMQTKFDPSKYQNVLAQQVGEYLERLQAGQEPVPIRQKASAAAPAGSLEEMLKASIKTMKPARRRKVA